MCEDTEASQGSGDEQWKGKGDDSRNGGRAPELQRSRSDWNTLVS
ncbi:unnamed protein product [Linum tenue]|uniref:Uncharacterized protein n=1 Tax=Linum tenue TaxID=586396 RepID=A0AAV0KIV5_9ROSI|nr:unnamed protein product [Linum tenue]